ncbi:hypothetical protein BH11PSE3_BH11PSE3_19420 [soil metagenome]
MMKPLLSVIVVVALVGTFVLAPKPRPLAQPVASRPAASPPALIVGATDSAGFSLSTNLPVPLGRGVRAAPMSPELVERPNHTEAAVAVGVDMGAARMAIEGDGYKGVSGLAKDANGRWRAKAYRGTVEVRLIVDSAGSVSAE